MITDYYYEKTDDEFVAKYLKSSVFQRELRIFATVSPKNYEHKKLPKKNYRQ